MNNGSATHGIFNKDRGMGLEAGQAKTSDVDKRLLCADDRFIASV